MERHHDPVDPFPKAPDVGLQSGPGAVRDARQIRCRSGLAIPVVAEKTHAPFTGLADRGCMCRSIVGGGAHARCSGQLRRLQGFNDPGPTTIERVVIRECQYVDPRPREGSSMVWTDLNVRAAA